MTETHHTVSGEPRRLPIQERLALTVEEAALLLGISRSKAYELVKSGDLPSVRLGDNVLRVPRRALDDLIEAAMRGAS